MAGLSSKHIVLALVLIVIFLIVAPLVASVGP